MLILIAAPLPILIGFIKWNARCLVIRDKFIFNKRKYEAIKISGGKAIKERDNGLEGAQYAEHMQLLEKEFPGVYWAINYEQTKVTSLES